MRYSVVLIQLTSCKRTIDPYKLDELFESNFKLEVIENYGKSVRSYEFNEGLDSVTVIKKDMLTPSPNSKHIISNQEFAKVKNDIRCISQYNSHYIKQKYSSNTQGRVDYKISTNTLELELNIIGPINCDLLDILTSE